MQLTDFERNSPNNEHIRWLSLSYKIQHTDSSFLEGVLTETGLEDLYAIWKDDPTAWTKTTWAWAGALLAFFGLLMFCICARYVS